MAVIRWAGFSGENRVPDPKMLADGSCSRSRNHKPTRGDLRPWRNPKSVATVPAGAKTIYRMGRDVASDADYWLSWPTVVHAIRGSSSTDGTERTFYTGDGAPKVTDNVLALSSAPYPAISRPMGIPAPATPLLVQTDDGDWSGEEENFTYAYTFVTDWGWESAPSPGSLVNTRKSDATATLSGFAAAPAGNYGVDRIRIYRTQTGASGSTTLFFLREISYGTPSVQDDNRSLGEELPTFNPAIPGSAWLQAPDDLSFLISIWNGMAVGISGGALRFCEPRYRYAWPLQYEIIPRDGSAIGLGYAGQHLLVLTSARPELVTGTSPDSMDQQPLEFSQGCISSRSIVSMGAGVAWASNDGLCWWGPSTGAKILTAGFMTREDWLKIKPETVVGQLYEGLYFGSYDDGTGRKGFVIDPNNPTGFYPLEAGYEAMHFDELQDQLYVLDGASVQRWDAGDTFMTASATSKEYRLPLPSSFSRLEVIARGYPVQVDVDWLDLKPDEADRLVAECPLLTRLSQTSVRYAATVEDRSPVPLPTGWHAGCIQLSTSVDDGSIQGIAIASSIEEIAQT
jgi:hypothetical protein